MDLLNYRPELLNPSVADAMVRQVNEMDATVYRYVEASTVERLQAFSYKEGVG